MSQLKLLVGICGVYKAYSLRTVLYIIKGFEFI